jgi:hypothetical protein
MQGKEHLLEMQNAQLHQLRKNIAELHCIVSNREDEGYVENTQDGQYCNPRHTFVGSVRAVRSYIVKRVKIYDALDL